MILIVLVLIALLSLSAPAHAQQMNVGAGDSTETNRPAIIPFLEGTDVFWTLWRFEDIPTYPGANQDPGRFFPTKLEADIFPHLVVVQNFTDVLDIDKPREREGLRDFTYSISGTPAVRIRMLRDVSAPVRTPSFMPRVNLQLLWARNAGAVKSRARQAAAARSTGAPQDLAALFRELPSVRLWEVHLIGGHHSNGQDGCITTVQNRVPPLTGDCEPADVVPTRDQVNRRDGSFSTNYIRTGLNYSRHWMESTPDLQAVREARIRAEFEYHPRAWVDDNIVDLYGRARVLVGGSYAVKSAGWCKKRLEGSAGLVWNPGVVSGVPELSTTWQASCFPTENGGWGFFARLYSGQDYYNIGFLDGITRLHIGATFNQADFFRFRQRRP